MNNKIKNKKKDNKKSNKKTNDTIAYCVCKLYGDTEFLKSQIRKSDISFAEALQHCEIKNPIYYCRIKRPVLITDLIQRINESSLSGRYEGHNDFVILPSLKYPHSEFNKLLITNTINSFESSEKKTFYIFAKYNI